MLGFIVAVALEFIALRWLHRRIGSKLAVMVVLAIPIGVVVGLCVGAIFSLAFDATPAEVFGTAIRSAATQSVCAVMVLFCVRWLEASPSE